MLTPTGDVPSPLSMMTADCGHQPECMCDPAKNQSSTRLKGSEGEPGARAKTLSNMEQTRWHILGERFTIAGSKHQAEFDSDESPLLQPEDGQLGAHRGASLTRLLATRADQ